MKQRCKECNNHWVRGRKGVFPLCTWCQRLRLVGHFKPEQPDCYLQSPTQKTYSDIAREHSIKSRQGFGIIKRCIFGTLTRNQCLVVMENELQVGHFEAIGIMSEHGIDFPRQLNRDRSREEITEGRKKELQALSMSL